MATKKGPKKPSAKGSTQGTSLAAVSDVTQDAKRQLIRDMFRPGRAADVGAKDISGTGFTYRHDWGNQNGQKRYILNIGGVNCNSRVFVSASEFGGGAQCDFVGDARYTVHNVAASTNQIIVRLNVEWPSLIRVRLTYLVINP